MKGIILAGGAGTRLSPLTLAVSKQLLPVYDKPMIFYPLSVLMLAGIREILLITTELDADRFKTVLGNGAHLGIELTYATQDQPRGIADAFIIGRDFIGNSSVSLILGDNIFWGQGLTPMLNTAVKRSTGATIFGYKVSDPHRFGIAVHDEKSNVLDLEEKPTNPKSNTAVTGLYFYDNDVVDLVKEVEVSSRGELEITSLNKIYAKNKRLKIEIMGRGFAWLDTGTIESLLEASSFISTIEKRQGLKIGCIEEIAYNRGWIDAEQVKRSPYFAHKCTYSDYLKSLIG